MSTIGQWNMGIKWVQIRPRFATLVRSRAREIAEENVIISLEEQNRMESGLFRSAAEAVRTEEGKGSRVHIDEVTQKVLELAESLVSELGDEVNERSLINIEAEHPELAAFLREAMRSPEVEGEVNRVVPEHVHTYIYKGHEIEVHVRVFIDGEYIPIVYDSKNNEYHAFEHSPYTVDHSIDNLVKHIADNIRSRHILVESEEGGAL